jgi:hypothetical protein
MRNKFLFLAILCLFALPAQAQVNWQLQVYQVGVDSLTGSPFYTLDLPPAAIICNTTQVMPTPPSTPINPKELWWTYSDQVCKADLSGQSGFIALPVGGPYPFSMTASNEVGTSARTAGSDPFRRVDLAVAPTLVVIK